MPMNVRNAMYISSTDPIDIINTTKKLKPKQSTGFDEISTKLMLHIIDEISLPFTHIVNTSFTTGIVPRQMKIAKVIPIHKQGNQRWQIPRPPHARAWQRSPH